MVLLAFIAIVIMLPLLETLPVPAKAQPKALIVSSLERYSPMGHLDAVANYLKSAGYNVTFVSDTAVTIKFLTTQLSAYDVIIWRTDVYDVARTTYWFLGEMADQETSQAYASGVAAGWLDNSHGILGVSIDFFRYHFTSNSLANVKVAILMSSTSISIANVFVEAGVKATVDYYASFGATSNLGDYTTQLLTQYLAAGQTVKDSVTNTVNHFASLVVSGSLDPNYLPPVSYLGDGSVTII
jgi:hypothetical protein